MKEMIFVNLAGPFSENLTYRENIMPKYFSQKGYKVTILTSMDEIDKKRNTRLIKANMKNIILDDYEVLRLRYRFIFLTKLFYRKLRFYLNFNKEIIKLNPSLIYINALQFGSIHELKEIKLRNPKVQIIAELNSTFENSGNNFPSKLLHRFFYGPLIKESLGYIDHLFFGSESAYLFSKYYYKIDVYMDLLTLGVDDVAILDVKSMKKNSVLRKFNLFNDENIVLTGGKIDKNKRIIDLICAFKTIQNNNSRLVIFGSVSPDTKNEFYELIKDVDNIIYMGWLVPNDIYELMHVASLAVFPGAKSALWESAVAFGVPLIASRWLGMNYIDFGGNIEYLSENWSSTELQKVLSDLLNSPNKLNQMSKIADHHWYENLAYTKLVAKVLAKVE